jgi:hypothetical protein
LKGPRRKRAFARHARLVPGNSLTFFGWSNDVDGRDRCMDGDKREALAGDRKGQHSIRINDKFRVCFVWTAEGPAEVEIVDYH